MKHLFYLLFVSLLCICCVEKCSSQERGNIVLCNFGGGNIIKWCTLEETKVDYFSIQVSQDGSNFKEIKKVDGQFKSNELTKYFYVDRHFKSTSNYYRIVSYDYDGDIIKITKQESIDNSDYYNKSKTN